MKLFIVMAMLFALGLASSYLLTGIVIGAERFALLAGRTFKRFSEPSYIPEMALANYTLTGKRRGMLQSALAALVLVLLPFSAMASSTVATRLAEASTTPLLLADVRRQLTVGDTRARHRGDEEEIASYSEVSGPPPDIWAFFDRIHKVDQVAGTLVEQHASFARALYLHGYKLTINLLQDATVEYSEESGDWVFRHKDYMGSITRARVVEVIDAFRYLLVSGYLSDLSPRYVESHERIWSWLESLADHGEAGEGQSAVPRSLKAVEQIG